MTEDHIEVLTIVFNIPLTFQEVPLFRGAIINMADSDDVLFHNHVDNNFRYAYPLIQYKQIKGRAAIVCMGEGAEALWNVLSSHDLNVNIGHRNVQLEVDHLKTDITSIQPKHSMQTYFIKRYLALNQKNFDIYRKAESREARRTLLKQCLTGNIITLAKGMHIQITEPIVVEILHVDALQAYKNKGVDMAGFDIVFNCNVSLPDHIGLGKSVSKGFGMVESYEAN